MVTGLVLKDSAHCWFVDFLHDYLMGLGVICVDPCSNGCCICDPLSKWMFECGGKTWFGVICLQCFCPGLPCGVTRIWMGWPIVVRVAGFC